MSSTISPAGFRIVKSWEYHILKTNGQAQPVGVATSLDETLKTLGSQNWELAAVADTSGGKHFIFKRPVYA